MYSTVYLAHSGRKGQKWGVRRWQNKDGSLTPAGRIHYGYGSERDSSRGSSNSDQTVEGEGKSKYEKPKGKTYTAKKGDYRDADDTSSTTQKKAEKKNPKDNTPKKDSTDSTAKTEKKTESTPPKATPPTDIGPSEAELARKYGLESKTLQAGKNLTDTLSKMTGKSADKKLQDYMDDLNFDNLSNQELQEKINRYNLERQYKSIVASVTTIASGKQRLQDTLELAGSVLAIGASAATIASLIHEMRK